MRVILSHQAKKFMLALDEKRYRAIREILAYPELNAIPFQHVDVRKLVGSKTGFRIRKGKIRILYSTEKDINQIFVEKIDWCDETTYHYLHFITPSHFQKPKSLYNLLCSIFLNDTQKRNKARGKKRAPAPQSWDAYWI